MASFRIDMVRLLRDMAGMGMCPECGATYSGKFCSTCEATQYMAGDAFTRLCSECMRGFATSDPNRDLCCFCMRREGDFHGRNRRANPTLSCGSYGAADHGPSGAFATVPAASWPRTFARKRASHSVKNAGIRTGEIIAWRAWRIQAFDKKLWLKSMAVDCIWAPNEPVSINSMMEQAGFKDRIVRVPPTVGAGVHAFKDKKYAEADYGHQPYVVYGTVALWGEVIEHEHGYRAEFGKVNTIDYFQNHDEGAAFNAKVLTVLRHHYGVSGKFHTDFKIG